MIIAVRFGILKKVQMVPATENLFIGQAWRNGLQNFLSDAPSLTDSGQGGLSTVTQYAGGVVVVDALEGTPLPHHGPAINFWPSVFVMGPENVTRVAF